MLEKSIKANKLNEKLVPQLKKIVPKEKYGELTEVLIEILLRRQKEFGLDDDRILNEAKSMVENLPKIQISLKKDPYHPSWWALCGQEGIEISYEFLKKMVECGKMEIIYETLTHEIYHAINMGSSIEEATSSNRMGLNEAFNEAAANRACTNANLTDKKHGYRLTNGYNSLTFISHAIAAATGISERQLLKAGISICASWEFIKLVKNHELQISNCSEGSLLSNDAVFGTKGFDMRLRSQKLLDSISKQIEVMHYCDYTAGGNDISEDKRNTRRSKAMKQLSKILFRYMSQQIDRDKREITPELIGEYVTRYKQLCVILENRQSEYLGDIKILDDKDVQKEMRSLAVKIICHSLKYKERNEKIRELQKQGIDCVQYIRELKYKNGDYGHQILLEDFDEDFVWDNSAINTFMNDWCTREIERFETSISNPEMPTSVPKALASVIDSSKQSTRVCQIDEIITCNGNKQAQNQENIEDEKNV